MEKKKFGAFTSSTNPNEISLTVESVIKLIALAVGGWAAVSGNGMIISDAVVNQTIDGFTVIITSGLAIWQSANLLFGVFRKLVKQD